MAAGRKWLFLNEAFLSNGISAALGRNKTCRENGLKDKSEILGRALRTALINLAAQYSSPVGEEEHIQKIAELAAGISTSCAECLKNGFGFGAAHKAVNVYLKFLWCEFRIAMPPHCPFDDGMIRRLKLPRGCGRKWTRGTEQDYRAWVAGAKQDAGTEPLALWELRQWPTNA